MDLLYQPGEGEGEDNQQASSTINHLYNPADTAAYSMSDLDEHELGASQMVVLPHGRVACIGSELSNGAWPVGWVRVLDVGTGELVCEFSAHSYRQDIDMVVVSTGQLVTCGADDESFGGNAGYEAYVWDIAALATAKVPRRRPAPCAIARAPAAPW